MEDTMAKTLVVRLAKAGAFKSWIDSALEILLRRLYYFVDNLYDMGYIYFNYANIFISLVA